MKRILTIKHKLLIAILGVSIIAFSLAIGYISISAKKTVINDAIALTNTLAEKYSAEIQSLFENDLSAMQALSRVVLTYKSMPEKQWKEIFADMYYEYLKGNPQILAVWDSWELSHLDPTHNKPYGRYRTVFWRDGQQIKSNFSIQSLSGDSPSYARVKQNAKDCIENPYFYSYSETDQDQLLMTSVISPIIDNGKFIGVVGVDIRLDRYQPIILQIKPYKGSYAFLMANDFQYVSHPNQDKQGQSVLEDYESTFDQFEATQKIVNGETCSFVARDINAVKSYFVFTPIFFGHTGTNWSLAIVVPLSSVNAKAKLNFIISLIVGFLGIIALAVVTYYISTRISNSLISTTNVIKRMALGHISKEMELPVTTSDEIGQMAQALNETIEGLNQKVVFATKIGAGEIDYDYKALGNDDVLGAALLDMRHSIKTSQEEEKKRRIEDNQRQWANEGVVKFGDILRQNNDDMNALSRSVIKGLVEMLDANQGGLFLFNDDDPDDPHFKLMANFAYNRYKYKQKKILPGEGLIGACAIEKKTIYLTEIPDGYIEITSGLGKSNPKSLLIAPLNLDNTVLGVVEVASFNPFEDYQIEFVERICETIASTLSSVKINIKTASLLAKTQQQAEEMQAQDEEMRQNMEELQATQEESFRKTAELQSIIDALNYTSYTVEYDIQGYITSVNNAYLDLLGLSRDTVIGTHYLDKIDLDDERAKEYGNMWNDLRNGIPKKTTSRFLVNGKLFVFQETFNPLKDDQGTVYKILKISNNITNLVTDK